MINITKINMTMIYLKMKEIWMRTITVVKNSTTITKNGYFMRINWKVINMNEQLNQKPFFFLFSSFFTQNKFSFFLFSFFIFLFSLNLFWVILYKSLNQKTSFWTNTKNELCTQTKDQTTNWASQSTKDLVSKSISQQDQ